MHPGHATESGTAGYADRFPAAAANGFYRRAQSWTVSSLGLGTYLGERDEQSDRGYVEAVTAALGGGINFLDTSLNYRQQNSERNIGAALAPLLDSGEVRREELIVCTKAGYLAPGAVPAGVLRPEDVAGGMHSMAPAFLRDQLERSRRNLNLETIEVFYLHNPETQLAYLTQGEFHERIARAFEAMEELAEEGKIGCYGAATWQGFRTKAGASDGLWLGKLLEIAARAGGDQHRFRFIQLPFNLAMVEAFTLPREKLNGEMRSVLEAAAEGGVTVVASASLLQARLSRELPEEIGRRLSGPRTDAQRAIQFTRSTPGIAVALVGMGRVEHVEHNLGVTKFRPASRDEFMTLMR